MLQTNHLPFVNWSDKYKPMRKRQELRFSEQFDIKLSILQQFLLSNAAAEELSPAL